MYCFYLYREKINTWVEVYNAALLAKQDKQCTFPSVSGKQRHKDQASTRNVTGSVLAFSSRLFPRPSGSSCECGRADGTITPHLVP